MPPDLRSIWLSERLLLFYQSQEIYSWAPGAIDYLSGLAARYACSTSPQKLQSDERALESYALWLSLVWLIDAIFDQDRSLTSDRDRDELIGVIVTLKEVNGSNPLCRALFETVRQGFLKHLQLTEEHRAARPEAHRQLQIWLVRYLRTLTDTNDQSMNLPEYARWRLDGGAMMCVAWHLRLLVGGEDLPILYELVALQVSYENDLLSFARDREQKTPNLVDVFSGDDWTRMKQAVQLVNRLGEQIERILQLLGPEIGELPRVIVEGSHQWAFQEARYSAGQALLETVQTEDRAAFEELLKHTERAAGDPELSGQ